MPRRQQWKPLALSHDIAVRGTTGTISAPAPTPSPAVIDPHAPGDLSSGGTCLFIETLDSIAHPQPLGNYDVDCVSARAPIIFFLKPANYNPERRDEIPMQMCDFGNVVEGDSQVIGSELKLPEGSRQGQRIVYISFGSELFSVVLWCSIDRTWSHVATYHDEREKIRALIRPTDWNTSTSDFLKSHTHPHAGLSRLYRLGTAKTTDQDDLIVECIPDDPFGPALRAREAFINRNTAKIDSTPSTPVAIPDICTPLAMPFVPVTTHGDSSPSPEKIDVSKPFHEFDPAQSTASQCRKENTPFTGTSYASQAPPVGPRGWVPPAHATAPQYHAPTRWSTTNSLTSPPQCSPDYQPHTPYAVQWPQEYAYDTGSSMPHTYVPGTTYHTSRGLQSGAIHPTPQGFHAGAIYHTPQELPPGVSHQTPQGLESSAIYQTPQQVHHTPQGLQSGTIYHTPRGLQSGTIYHTPQDLHETHHTPQDLNSAIACQQPARDSPVSPTMAARTLAREALMKMPEQAMERNKNAEYRTVLYDPYQDRGKTPLRAEAPVFTTPARVEAASKLDIISPQNTQVQVSLPPVQQPIGASVALLDESYELLSTDLLNSSPDSQWESKPVEIIRIACPGLAGQYTKQNFHGPFFMNELISPQRQPDKLHDQQINDWWWSGNKFNRQEDFYQSVVAIKEPKVASPAKATLPRDTTPAKRPGAFDLGRMMVPMLENLSSYIDSPASRRRDYFSRWAHAPEWCFDRSAEGCKSYFDKDWINPPARIGRDPRYRDMPQFGYHERSAGKGRMTDRGMMFR